MQKKLANVPKKKYQTPSLTIHGTVQKLTQALYKHGNKDGTSPASPRTHT